jgi:hypothetical protein
MVCEKQLKSQHNRNRTNQKSASLWVKSAGRSNTQPNSQNSTKGAQDKASTDEPKKDRREARPDWLSFAGCLTLLDIEAVRTLLEVSTKQVFAKRLNLRMGNKRCGTGYISPGNISIVFSKNRDEETGKHRVQISIPGEPLAAMEVTEVHALAKTLKYVYKLKCSHIDIALDDYGKHLSFPLIIAALEAGNYRGFKKWNVHRSSDNPYSDDKTVRGMTVYNGTRNSDRHLCIYDRGEFIRLEARFSNRVADKVLMKWLAIDPENEAKSTHYLAASVLGTVDYINRISNPDEKNIKRLPRLKWWEDFRQLVLGGKNAITHKRPYLKARLVRSTNWQRKQVMRTLVVVIASMGLEDGFDWFKKRFNEAKASLKEWHHVLIEQFASEYQQLRLSGDDSLL